MQGYNGSKDKVKNKVKGTALLKETIRVVQTRYQSEREETLNERAALEEELSYLRKQILGKRKRNPQTLSCREPIDELVSHIHASCVVCARKLYVTETELNITKEVAENPEVKQI